MNISAEVTKRHKYHYVYKITNLFPAGAERFYIGTRSCNVRPERDNYWSSSSYLKEAIKQQGKIDFAKEILSTWKTREEALEEEIRLHAEIGVKDNPEYYNKSNQTSTRFDTTGSESVSRKMKSYWSGEGVKQMHSEITKKQLSTPDARKMLSDRAKGQWDDLSFRKMHVDKMKRRWEDPAVREAMLATFSSAEYREKAGQRTKDRARNYEIVSPTGERFVVKGGEPMREFAKEHCLSNAGLKRMSREPEYRYQLGTLVGWTCCVLTV